MIPPALPTFAFATSRYAIVVGVGILISGCGTLHTSQKDTDAMPVGLSTLLPQTRLFDAIPKEKLNTASRQLAADGIKALDAKDYRRASDIFNLAVKTDMTNSYLHFLNAVAYQMRGIVGESGLFPLAEQGYQTAVKFDDSNWLARYYGGLLAMNQHNWAEAQTKLLEAALYAGKNPDLLYDLAVAAYYNHDPKTASGALAGLREIQGDRVDPKVLKASALVAAALGQSAEADQFVARLQTGTTAPDELDRLKQRVDSWQSAFDRSKLIKTQATGNTFGTVPSFGAQPAQGATPFGTNPQFGGQLNPGQMPYGAQQQAFGANGAFGQPGRSDFVEKKMVVVDVVIISTEEDNTHSMGVNLLDGLKLQFGSTALQSPGFSNQFTTTLNSDGSTANTGVVTRLISVPAVNYSLNIANANAKRNEVLARPTLVALGNQTSQFFSGVDVNAAAISNGQGAAVQIQKEVGVKLAVTPEFLPGNLIKLNVAAERTFLAIPSNSVKFDFRLDTAKTTVNANVVMKLGETLILSGLSERDQSRDRDGVPGLQDLPMVQYLFSRNVTRDYYKSVLILITPRQAQYTNRSEEDVNADRAQATPSELAMAEFESKYKPWFQPIPNIGEITKQLETNNSLYREFRTGDLVGSWQSLNNHHDRLTAALGFLFY
jgi:Tfp pilus assembly protein PilF